MRILLVVLDFHFLVLPVLLFLFLVFEQVAVLFEDGLELKK